jgi:GNAT superfamily N-acetyltransferase
MHDCNGGTFIANYSVKQQKMPLGSGVAFPVNDDLCWIGMILVHPELRRQGIAGSIMNQCLKHARLIQNKSIVGLDATPLGKQVYDSLGFKDSFTIWRSVINTSSVDGNNESRDLSVIPFDLNSAKKYLQKVGYAERLGIMEILGSLPETKNFMVFESSDIKGIILSRPGRLKPYIGPLIADSSTVALILIQKALNYWKELDHEEVLMDIPAQHLNDSIFINGDKSLDVDNHQIPVKPIRSFIRMYQLVFDAELLESPSDPAMKKALNCHEETAVFMQKEKEEIVPIMFGTSGPEWS